MIRQPSLDIEDGEREREGGRRRETKQDRMP